MSLENRASTAAAGLRAATTPDAEAGLAELRRAHRRRRTSRMAAAGVAAAGVVIVAGAALGGDRDTAVPAPAGPPSGTVSPSAIEPIATKTWTTYKSGRYDLKVGHPPDWTKEPANRAWTWESDVADHLSPAHEAFLSPDGHVRVSVWNAPFDAGTRQESIPDLVEWVEDYCEASGNSPCTGIEDRAVELCLEKWDCHPGLLVPFEHDVQAFVSGGIYDADAMTVVAVWWGESAPAVARYGGSQRLLEAFLSTMEIWPASTPQSERR